MPCRTGALFRRRRMPGRIVMDMATKSPARLFLLYPANSDLFVNTMVELGDKRLVLDQ
jgi:hypothetical protein